MDNYQQRSAPGNSAHRNSAESDEATKWIIETEHDRTGAHHMERDNALALARTLDPALPNVLRLYSWQPAAVSIGYQQKLESIDLTACERHGIDVVRRPTGGRAVLHARELTYAVIMRAEIGQGIYDMHNLIVTALLESLAGLGPEYSSMAVTGRNADRNFQTVYQAGTLTNAACFASSARHEVTYNGRKVIGSAQRRYGEVALQHGSILLTNDHLKLPDLLALSAEERIRMHELLERETATLSDVFGRLIAPAEAGEHVRTTFVRHITEFQTARRALTPRATQQIILS